MKQGGTIIRLVDVAMIILFGFIVISRLKLIEIEMPSTVKAPQKKSEKHIIKIIIFRDVNNFKDRFILYEENGTKIGDFEKIVDLEPVLIQKNLLDQKKNVQLVVLIEPDEDSIIQHTVDILDLCKKYNIAKNINYESLEL